MGHGGMAEEHFLEADGFSFRYQLSESVRRRRVAFCVNRDGILEVRVPAGFGSEHAEELCREHLEMIRRLFRRFTQLSGEIRRYNFTEGEEFFLFGRRFPLRFTGRICRFNGEAFLVPAADAEGVRNSLAQIYRRALRELLEPQAAQMAASVGRRFTSLRISSANRRWGSCSSAGGLSFSWRLAQCPPELIEYVIWHELAHLDEMSHSARFYRILAGYLPEHTVLRKKLQRFSSEII